MKKSEFILKIASEIEAVIDVNRIPITNPSVVARLSNLVHQLRGVDHDASEDGRRLLQVAEIFYSQRKHEKYRGGSEQAYSDMTYQHLLRLKDTALKYEQIDSESI
jgi:hypothetical protein